MILHCHNYCHYSTFENIFYSVVLFSIILGFVVFIYLIIKRERNWRASTGSRKPSHRPIRLEPKNILDRNSGEMMSISEYRKKYPCGFHRRGSTRFSKKI